MQYYGIFNLVSDDFFKKMLYFDTLGVHSAEISTSRSPKPLFSILPGPIDISAKGNFGAPSSTAKVFKQISDVLRIRPFPW